MFFRKVIIIIKIVPTFWFYINAICKLKNDVIACFPNLCFGIFSNKWRYNTSQDWKYFKKTLKIST